MEFKVVYIFVFTVFFCVVNLSALPRDSSVVKVDPVEHIHGDTTSKDFKVVHSENEVQIPGRVSCLYDEATEDPVCQEHCFPKGYKYGLCVSNICSCI